MIVIPAIDIKNGKCVRLTQGDFNKEKIYEEDPVFVAQKFEQAGAEMIHAIDLDGAKTGEMKNKSVIEQIINSVQIPIQIGGGIRNIKTIASLSSSASRVILGTSAIENISFLKQAIQEYKEKIAVSLDAENGKLKTQGWQKSTDTNVFEFAKELEDLGVQTIIYTDISRDGTLTSPNLDSIQKLRTIIKGFLIASGGVSSLEDIKKLKEIGADGVITGKALYEKKIDLKEAIANAC